MTMIADRPLGSPSFRLVAKGLIELHGLIKDGKDDSAEAELVRDSLDAPLRALNSTEKDRAKWLSEDLYSISEPGPATSPKPITAEAQRALNQAREARQNGEWDKALELLRRSAAYVLPA